MIQIFSNNVSTTLGADLTNSATTLTLASASGFPTPTTDQYFLITITQGAGDETSHEVIRVTGRSGTTLTGLVRGQEGTTAAAWTTGAKVEMRLTAGSLDSLRADFTPINHSVMQLYLMSAVVSAIASNSVSNGMFDAFNVGTTLSSSVGGTYNSSGKYWENPSSSGGDQIPTMTSATTPSGIVTYSTQQDTNYAGWKAFDKDLTGNTSAWATSIGGSVGWLAYEFPLAKTISSYSVTYGASGWGSGAYAPRDWTFEGWTGSAWVVLDTRSSQTGWSYSETRTFTIASPASYIKYRINVSANNGATQTTIQELKMFSTGGTLDMTLVSQTLSPAPLAAPSKLDLQVWWKPIDTITLNTDLIAEGTRDGGTTWTAGTLVDSGIDPVSGFNLLKASISLNGQPSGTSVQYRLRSANSKSQQIKGVALMYS